MRRFLKLLTTATLLGFGALAHSSCGSSAASTGKPDTAPSKTPSTALNMADCRQADTLFSRDVPRPVSRALGQQGFRYLGQRLRSHGYDVVLANRIGAVDGHQNAVFFVRNGSVAATDLVKGSRFHFSASICNANNDLVSTQYALNVGVGGHIPSCPPPRVVTVRWRIGQTGVSALDDVPRDCVPH